MDSSLWVAKTGLDAQQRRMTVVANNLANVNTTGFKRDRAVFEDLLYQTIRQPGAQVGQDANSPTGLVLGTGTRVVATEKIHSQGNMIQTDNALDLAIDGDGFLQTLLQDGNIGYTRDGSLKLNNVGQLVTASGDLLQPAITIPANASSITIGKDGTVSVQTFDQAAGQVVGNIQCEGATLEIPPFCFLLSNRGQLSWSGTLHGGVGLPKIPPLLITLGDKSYEYSTAARPYRGATSRRGANQRWRNRHS
jgi:flagellar basal-body rod protein FlgB